MGITKKDLLHFHFHNFIQLIKGAEEQTSAGKVLLKEGLYRPGGSVWMFGYGNVEFLL